MQKEDIQWAVLGILILLVIALVIKPMATGQPVNIGLPTPATTQNSTMVPTPELPLTIPLVRAPPTTPSPTITPTPLPVWNGSKQTLNIVDPSGYGIERAEEGTGIVSTNIIDPQQNFNRNLSNMTVFVRFGDTGWTDKNGTHPARSLSTTQTINIPFPYWEIWYSADPVSSDIHKTTGISSYSVTQAPGVGISQGGVQGSYSTVMPKLSIQVMDADDPNRIVRTISPPGGIDPALAKTYAPSNASSRTPGKYTEPAKTGAATIADPRPWREQFFEGRKPYYFIIKTSALKSYWIEIRTKNEYIGKY